jgi:hypothetical protein
MVAFISKAEGKMEQVPQSLAMIFQGKKCNETVKVVLDRR